MSSPEKPLVYLLLGATGSGRRELLVDLIEAGLTETDRPAVMLPAGEPLTPDDALLPNVTHWTWQDGMIAGSLPEGASHVFFLFDGMRNPVDQIEVFRPWVEAQGGEVARALC